ncbi:uncharacterized protein G2W53_001254 [Senna tora]|uniref:Uncharacterized protein n=1 Tax=Senna tora TaxID=362788 RepID=A0A835CJ92_9FABA|nr:uncharacterized protein G2W53_001254 [Senna tora]
MAIHTFHAITSSVGALNPLEFPNTTRRDRHDFTHIPYDHEPYSSIKSTRIRKYNPERSICLAYATTRLNLNFLSSFEIQSRFSVPNAFRHDLPHFQCDHETHLSIKSTRIPVYNRKQSF